ncbi:Gldg family protein [Coraliomargarita akajimensis]|uniref:ABC-type uncharacterized transport system n=1 Tax=Coraliomargarita akajimensis (strain DSM 45221 / IAM 15411 / JCM 23193 / KCTC 12865 / 04OKA010-24) TaxID=583355 RepID=D5EN58_CORAD|nr:Gldg family protein [Coraliomargarita akajimensis]ADE53493.1 ABC-type uncharacterized transport system [Coraliomargarita akajimensis DSM 45221]
MHPLQRVYLIVLKELKTFLITPTLYVCIVLFTFLCSYLHFWVGDYLNGDSASLSQSFFRWHPWLYCLFAPAITMRLWSEEYRQQTIEYLITMGYRYWHLLVGKFIAAWIILGCALLLTFPIPATAMWLGDPDIGSLVSGYLGSFLVAGYFLAIASACAACTTNQFLAYILGACLSSVLLMFGSAPSMNTLLNVAPAYADWLIQLKQLSILTQFKDYQEGLIVGSSLISILSLIAVCLWLTNSYLVAKSQQAAFRLSSSRFILNASLPLSLFIAANMMGLMIPVQLDFTDSKRHSLSSTTLHYLSCLEHDIELELIYSGSNRGIPYDHRIHFDSTKRMLERMQRQSKGKLKLKLSDPALNSNALEKAKFEGLTELLFTESDINYFGMSARCLTINSSIAYLHPERSKLLEYDLMLLLDQVVPRERERIGVISSYPVTGGAAPNGQSFPSWLFVKELNRSYEVINYTDELASLTKEPPDLLVLLHPNGMQQEIEPLVDAYMQQGGKLIALLDAHSIVPTFLSPGIEDYSSSATSDLPTLLKAWGIEYSPTAVVADMDYASEINRGYGSELLHTVLNIPATTIDQSHPITEGIEHLGFIFSGFFKIDADHPWERVEPLVFSSINSSSVETEILHGMNRTENQSLTNRFVADGMPKALALKLTGKYPSLDASASGPTLDTRSEIVLFADADFLFDPFAGEAQKVAEDQNILNPYNGNIAMLTNAVDTLLERSTLAEARSRGTVRQSLGGLAHIKASIVTKYQDQRAQIEQSLLELNDTKSAMYVHDNSQTVDEQLKISQSIREKESEIRSFEQRRKRLEELVSQEWSSFLAKIQWTNILSIPALILCVGVFSISLRTQRTKAQ